MKYLVDSSVLIAAFCVDHQHHEPSYALLELLNKKSSAVAAHSLAEIYASLTRMPGKDRVDRGDALTYLKAIRENAQIVTLDEGEYFQAIENFTDLGLIGGGIYDALIAHCALKVGAESIYTWNVKDFTRLGADIAARVRTPDQI